jgi:hypothetical protein
MNLVRLRVASSDKRCKAPCATLDGEVAIDDLAWELARSAPRVGSPLRDRLFELLGVLGALTAVQAA